MKKINKTDEQWQKNLDDDQYHILREKGTEPPFSGELNDCHEEGSYHCAACKNYLFSSHAKFDSGSGWPSFFDYFCEDSIDQQVDDRHGMLRTEVLCKQCGGHLGHVFNDGPKPTGLRYCINSRALAFRKKINLEDE